MGSPNRYLPDFGWHNHSMWRWWATDTSEYDPDIDAHPRIWVAHNAMCGTHPQSAGIYTAVMVLLNCDDSKLCPELWKATLEFVQQYDKRKSDLSFEIDAEVFFTRGKGYECLPRSN